MDVNNNLTIHTYPSRRLASYIEAFRVYHFDEGAHVQLLPKGVFEIVFQSQDCFEHNTYYSTGWEQRPQNFIGGLHNKSYYVKSEVKKGYCIAVEFKPNTAKFFIPEKLNYFQHSVIDIKEIWGRSAAQLLEKLEKEKSDHLKIRWIEDFLYEKFNRQNLTKIDHALNYIMASKGEISVSELAIHAALSVSQFRKRFKEEIGISPSQYSKIRRINAALPMIQNLQHSLTDISYDLGYFDQAHFIKDFKSVLGVSPKKYRSMS